MTLEKKKIRPAEQFPISKIEKISTRGSMYTINQREKKKRLLVSFVTTICFVISMALLNIAYLIQCHHAAFNAFLDIEYNKAISVSGIGGALLFFTAVFLISQINYKDSAERLKAICCIILCASAVIFICNNIVPFINFTDYSWTYPRPFLAKGPTIGYDFLEGLYGPATLLRNFKTPNLVCMWPPFTALIGLPFTLFPYQLAYVFQVWFLCVLNVSTLYISVRIAQLIFQCADTRGRVTDDFIIPLTICTSMVALTLTSYGFLFSLERGNIDIYAQFCAAVGIFLMISKDRSAWIPVLLISIAAFIKLYPAILFIIIFWRYRWKCTVPILIINTVLFFSVGIQPAVIFVKYMINFVQDANICQNNHSAASFAPILAQGASRLLTFYHAPMNIIDVVCKTAPFMCTTMPLLLWLAGLCILLKRGFNKLNAVLLYTLSIPVMLVVPPTSYDYKLVILSSPVAIIVFGLVVNFSVYGQFSEIIKIIFIMVIMTFITRSAFIMPYYFANHYIYIMLFQVIVFIMIAVPSGVFKPDHSLSECPSNQG